MFYAYVVNGPGCLLCLVAFALGLLLNFWKAGDTATLLTMGCVLLIDLIGRAVANFRRHPATREWRCYYLPSAGAHFNYVPVWILGVLVLLALPVEKLVKAYVAGQYPFGERRPVAQKPPDTPTDPKPVVQVPPVSLKPTSTGAKFDYDVRKAQLANGELGYEIVVTSRHDKPLKNVTLNCLMIPNPPGKPVDKFAQEKQVSSGQRLSMILQSASGSGLLQIHGIGWEEDGTKVTFTCRWPL